MKEIILEICVDSVGSAAAAEKGGAHRVELCADPAAGGTTPSHGLIRAVRARLGIPVHVLVRPRPGDFVYSRGELDIIRDDILRAKDLGADGVVVGCLAGRRTVDRKSLERFVRAAGPMSVTFHRAFDAVRAQGEALETLIDAGVERVLTSGRAAAAFAGRGRLRGLVARSSGRIAVMAGGGIGIRSVGALLRESGVGEVHVGSGVTRVRSSGDGPFRAAIGTVDPGRVESFVKILGRHGR